MYLQVSCPRLPDMFLNISKSTDFTFGLRSEFEQTTIEYLGLKILEGKAEMDLVKVQGVTAWPTPSS